jgi:peptide/nickel transport system substrate-binding protein
MLLSSLRPDSPECCHKGYDYDLDMARQLLAEAGWTDSDGDGILDKNGTSLKDLDLVISSASSLGWQKDLALVVQSQLKKIGIDVQIQMVESVIYQEVISTRDFDLRMAYNMGRSYSTISEFNSFNRKGPSLINDYCDQDETLATFVEGAKTADSIDDRDEYLCQACDILYEEAGIIPLVYEMQYAVMSNKVNGFQLGLSQNAYYTDHEEECWIE